MSAPLLAAFALAMSVTLAWAATPTTLVSFNGSASGAYPHARLIQGTDDAFYGTTDSGGNAAGVNGHGTVFRVTAAGALTTLYTFSSGGADGIGPSSSLVQGSDGALYGTTDSGGAKNYGTVYRVTSSGAFTTLYSFTGGTDGTSPVGLTLGSDGNLYGATNLGGSGGYGTIFCITSAGAVTTLVSFKGGSDGGVPDAPPILGADGAFYGATAYGGYAANYAGFGVLYRMTTAGALTTLYTFTGGSDGAYPFARLILGSDGSLYGSASASAAGSNRGTIYRLTTDGTFSTLYAFTGGSDGDGPVSGVIQASDGIFYGTTVRGGLNNDSTPADGTAFSLTAAGALMTLYTFSGANSGSGFTPQGGLVQGSDGYFYGTTINGGGSYAGTVYQLSAVGAPVTTTPTAPGNLQFGATAYAVAESAGKATVTVTRTGGSSGAVSVSYTAAAGTAIANGDFTPVSGTLNWADGDSAAKSFAVPIFDDTVIDPDLTVSLSLSSPTGGATLGSPNAAALTIIDNESAATLPTVTLTALGDGTLAEGGKKGKVLFTRSGDTSASLTVYYQLKGAATNGKDYRDTDNQLMSGSAVIPIGQSSVKIKIVARDDKKTEGAERLILVLQPSPSAEYLVGSPFKAKLTLIDND